MKLILFNNTFCFFRKRRVKVAPTNEMEMESEYETDTSEEDEEEEEEENPVTRRDVEVNVPQGKAAPR